MEKNKPPQTVKKEVMIRHLANLALFHGGFWHGTYYHLGKPQPHSKTGKVTKPLR